MLPFTFDPSFVSVHVMMMIACMLTAQVSFANGQGANTVLIVMMFWCGSRSSKVNLMVELMFIHLVGFVCMYTVVSTLLFVTLDTLSQQVNFFGTGTTLVTIPVSMWLCLQLNTRPVSS